MAHSTSTADDALVADGCYVALTDEPLDASELMQRVRSPKAGANVLFAGSTRDNFDGRRVSTLCYAAYRPRALRSMRDIAVDVKAAHGLLSVAIVHRLGPVPIGQDSVLIAVSAPHRQAAWHGGEACLERVKERVEIWKQEVFAADNEAKGNGPAEGERVWRANCDPTAGTLALAAVASTEQPQPPT